MVDYMLNGIVETILWQILNSVFNYAIRIPWLFCRKLMPNCWIRGQCINWTWPNWFHFCLYACFELSVERWTACETNTASGFNRDLGNGDSFSEWYIRSVLSSIENSSYHPPCRRSTVDLLIFKSQLTMSWGGQRDGNF